MNDELESELTFPRIGKLIWDEEQKVQKVITQGIERGNVGTTMLGHYNGILRGLQVARDIAEANDHSTTYAEQSMYFGECQEWIAALETWIIRQGLEVPSWKNVND